MGITISSTMAGHKGTKMEKKRTMSQLETFKLLTWMDANKETVQICTDEQVTESANRELGLGLTVNNIKGARKTLGIQYVDPGKPMPLVDKVEVLAKELREFILANRGITSDEFDKAFPTTPKAKPIPMDV